MFSVTVAFRIGTDCNSIRRIIHIGVPKLILNYFQFQFQFIYLPEKKNTFMQTFNILQKCYLKIIET